jgi:hypothetical protein
MRVRNIIEGLLSAHPQGRIGIEDIQRFGHDGHFVALIEPSQSRDHL